MVFKWKTWLITLLMLVALLMYVQPAWGRDGGGGGRGGGGGGGGFRGGGSSMRAPSGGGGGSFRSGGSFRGGGREFRGGSSFRSGGDRFIGGGSDRFTSNRGGRGGGERFISGSRGGRGDDRFVFNSGRGRGGGDRFAFRNRNMVVNNDFVFRRGFFNTSPFFLQNRFNNNNLGSVFGFRGNRFHDGFFHNRFRSHDGFFFHNRFRFHDRFFFNPFFHHRSIFFDPFFDRRIFFNPCFTGISPYYYGGYGYGAAPNYYTYNYYTNPVPETPAYDTTTPEQGTYAKPEEQTKKPVTPTTADAYFDQGVKAFGSSDYAAATTKFAGAMKLAPEDKVLPFAYAQAVFADGDYTEAVIALRAALAKVNPETEGVFYPRGMYASNEVLLRQVTTLNEVAARNTQNTNLQLLLGYHQLGMGDSDKAEVALKLASTDAVNGPPAIALLKMIDKLRTTEAENPKTQVPQVTPKTAAPKTMETPKKLSVPETPVEEAPKVLAPKVEMPII